MAGQIRTVPLEPLEEFLQADNHCHFARILGVHPGVIWPNHWFKEDI